MKLTPELENELKEKHKNLAIFEIGEHDFAIRFPNRKEYKLIKGLLEKIADKEDSDLDESLVHEICSLSVFPTPAQLDEMADFDGGLLDVLAKQFFLYYFKDRVVTAEKKRK